MIRNCIEQQLKKNIRQFIIYPFGDIGMQVAYILRTVYDIEPKYILDNYLCEWNPNIKPVTFLYEVDCVDCVVILASTNVNIYAELKQSLSKIISTECIVELVPDFLTKDEKLKEETKCITKIGRYSYESICRQHILIESIGAFCSFARGTEVVLNHPMNYITTHPMMYRGKHIEGFEWEYETYEKAPGYFEGVCPKDMVIKNKRCVIGNDVWLGQNVIVTNGAKIGNGVIAGAGSVITKDVPDYAVVAGVPAKILRFRYTPEQIDALNKIQWWNWTDDQIRERYDDLYLPIEQFIEKYS